MSAKPNPFSLRAQREGEMGERKEESRRFNGVFHGWPTAPARTDACLPCIGPARFDVNNCFGRFLEEIQSIYLLSAILEFEFKYNYLDINKIILYQFRLLHKARRIFQLHRSKIDILDRNSILRVHD